MLTLGATSPADALRANQAASTSAAELSKALTPSGLEETWHHGLARLPIQGSFRVLPTDQPVDIPLAAFDRLPERSLLAYLADEQHPLLLQLTSTGLKVSAKGILAIPSTLELNVPFWIGRGPAKEGERWFVLPDKDPWRVVSSAHVQLTLALDADRQPLLQIMHLSKTNGTYLSAAQVAAMLDATAGGLEESMSPEEAIGHVDSLLLSVPVVRLVGFPKGMLERVSERNLDALRERVATTLGWLPEESRLSWTKGDEGVWRLELLFMPSLRPAWYRRMSGLLRQISQHLREGWTPEQAMRLARERDGQHYWNFYRQQHGHAPAWRKDLVGEQLDAFLVEWSQGRHPVICDAQFARRVAGWIAVAIPISRRDNGHDMRDYAPPRITSTMLHDAHAQRSHGNQGQSIPHAEWAIIQDVLRRYPITRHEAGHGGLEEGAKAELQVLVVATTPQMREVLGDVVDRWELEHAYHDPELRLQVFPVQDGLLRPPDAVLAGVTVQDDTMKGAIEELREELARLGSYPRRAAPGTFGLVINAPWLASRERYGDHQERAEVERAVRDLLQDAFPSVTYALIDPHLSRDNASIQAVARHQLEAGILRQRGGLPSGQIFNAQTRAFTLMVAALLAQGSPRHKLLQREIALSGLSLPIARVLPETQLMITTSALPVFGIAVEPAPLLTASNTEARQAAMARQAGYRLWQLETEVRRRVLAMDEAQLEQLKTMARRIALGPDRRMPDEHPTVYAAVENELIILQHHVRLAAFFEAARQPSALWAKVSRAGTGFVTEFGQLGYRLSVHLFDLSKQPVALVTLRQKNEQSFGDVAPQCQRYVFRIRDAQTGDLSRPVRLQAGPRAEVWLEQMLSDLYGQAAQADDTLGNQIDLRGFSLLKEPVHVMNRLQLQIEGPGLPTRGGLEEGVVSIEEEVRTHADPSLQQYY